MQDTQEINMKAPRRTEPRKSIKPIKPKIKTPNYDAQGGRAYSTVPNLYGRKIPKGKKGDRKSGAGYSGD